MFGSTLNSIDNDSKPVISTMYVKYMVCLRDKMALKSVLNKHNLKCRISVHGAIECLEEMTEDQFYELKMSLAKSGLVLLEEKESLLIDRIINTIVEIIHYSDSLPRLSFRDIISKHAIPVDESILKIFSDVKGMSVLQFIVIQKIERAKELMLYDDKSLKEIADILNYKNKDYLIAQFKKTTGLTPSYFKRLKKERMRITQQYSDSTLKSTADGTSS